MSEIQFCTFCQTSPAPGEAACATKEQATGCPWCPSTAPSKFDVALGKAGIMVDELLTSYCRFVTTDSAVAGEAESDLHEKKNNVVAYVATAIAWGA